MNSRLIAGAIIEVAAAIMVGAGVIGMSVMPANNPAAVFSIAVGLVLFAFGWAMMSRSAASIEDEETES